MKKIIIAVLFAASLAGCGSFITSTMPSRTDVTGGAWYTRNTYFAGFLLSSDIFYCPPGEMKCIEAEIQ